jgi:hypothetical protein
MPEHQLSDVIDGIRTRLQAELEAQLGTIAESHAQALERARRAAESDAEQRWASKLQATQTEWTSRLEADLAKARAEADERWAAKIESTRAEWSSRLEAEVATARAEAERRLVAESIRVRMDAEQTAAESAGAARRELEAALVAERRQGEERLEAERQKIQQQTADAQAALDAERRLAQERIEAERRKAEQQTAEARAALDEERQQAQRRLESERDRAEREVAAARAQAEQERQSQTAAPAGAGDSRLDAARLLDSMKAIDEAGSLSDVLGLTAAAAAVEAPRSAVFVINGPQLEEWNLPELTPLSAAAVRIAGRDAGILGEAVLAGDTRVSSGNGTETGAPAFASLPAGRAAVAVPLMLGGQAVAALYADEGVDGDAASSWREPIQILGRHASACLAFLTAARTAQAMRLMSETGAATQPSGRSATSDDDQGARRYARLLVSEIKLYNEAAVRVGREKRDLGRRLAPEIERARRLYDERIPPGVTGRDACFEQELVQTLADGDRALLG